MVDNKIEPTTAQLEAAKDLVGEVLKMLRWETPSVAIPHVAKVLAKRDHAMQVYIDRSVAATKTALALHEGAMAAARTALAATKTRIAELEEKISDACFSCPRCGGHDFGFFSSQIKEACGPCRARAEAAEAREAEHLATIKALQDRAAIPERIMRHLRIRGHVSSFSSTGAPTSSDVYDWLKTYDSAWLQSENDEDDTKETADG